MTDKENAEQKLGKTAYYNPTQQTVYIYVVDRHLKDILRSVSHELIHHNQNVCGQMKNSSETPEGYAQSNPHLRELEKCLYIGISGVAPRAHAITPHRSGSNKFSCNRSCS